MAEGEQDEFAPVLAGPGSSDYERYLPHRGAALAAEGPR